MRNQNIGIISEGVEDQGVLKTILRAFDFDGSEIKLIRPGLAFDINDNQQTIGTFQGVKNACIGKNNQRPDFENAFDYLDCNNIIIQIDTAEIDRQDFIFVRPQKNENYSKELRNLVISLINNWLDNNYKEKILYAISIEEMEAWCLTIFEQKNTVEIVNSKDKLRNHLDKNNLTYQKLKINTKKKSEYFETFTSKNKFNKLKNLKQFAEYNQSLKDFINSLEEKIFNLN